MSATEHIPSAIEQAIKQGRDAESPALRLKHLATLRTQMEAADSALRAEVAEAINVARSAEMSWNDIAEALGVSRQRAMQLAPQEAQS